MTLLQSYLEASTNGKKGSCRVYNSCEPSFQDFVLRNPTKHKVTIEIVYYLAYTMLSQFLKQKIISFFRIKKTKRLICYANAMVGS